MCIPSLVLILALVAMLDNVTDLAPDGGRRRHQLDRHRPAHARPSSSSSSEMEFVTAARAMGAGQAADHVPPHASATRWRRCWCRSRSASPSAILIESGLSFLGFGASPPNPSWGTLLNAGRSAIEQMWWLILFPGLAIFLTVLAYNLIGEGLQEATDPRLRQAGALTMLKSNHEDTKDTRERTADRRNR